MINIFPQKIILFLAVTYIIFPPGTNNYIDESAFCAMMIEHMPRRVPLYELSTALFFVLPLFSIIHMYSKITVKLRSRDGFMLTGDGNVHSQRDPEAAKRVIIRMLGELFNMSLQESYHFGETRAH